MEGPITTDIWEIDFYKNGKIQYLFATNGQLHLLDYHGRSISKYPHPLPTTTQPLYLQVVDYNQDKQYRLLLATAQGDIYIKDKHYRTLPGWAPRAVTHSFASTPFHCRVRGKDYYLTLQADGTLQALNRKGKNYSGFPVALNAPVHNPLLVRKGKTTADTTLIVLTDAGKCIQMSLNGQEQAVQQLPRLKDTKRFVLCPDQVSGQRYIVMRQDATKGELMDEAGNLLFELPHAAPHWRIQYYDFGSSHQFYVLTDPDQHLTYLYDQAGKLLQDAPWPNNGQAVGLLFYQHKRQLVIYNCTGTQCLQFQLP